MKAKKLFTLLAILTLGITQLWAADPTYEAPATKTYGAITFLDVAGTAKNATDALGNDYLTYGVYYVAKTKGITTWFNSSDGSPASNHESTGYSIPDAADYGFFPVSSTSSDINYGGTKCHSTRQRYFYVTGATSVAAIVRDGDTKSNKYAQISIQTVAIDGTLGTATIYGDYGSKTSGYLLDGGALDPDKYYKISFTSQTTTNCFMYQIRLGKASVPSCDATAPGNISKGALSAGVLTLNAAGYGSKPATDEWYWQTAADGVDKSNSGASFNVTAAGTYYVRSLYNNDCWSDAKSFEVKATDLVANYTVIYKDGATELDRETVEVGNVPAGITAPTKDCYTFAGWDPALSGVSGSDGDEVVVNATWTPLYASSFNFGTTTDLTKDNIATKLAASNIFCSVGTGGSYDAGGTTGYLGYKFKNNGDYVTFIVQDGYEAIVTYGYTESGWQVNGVDAGVTVKTQAYVDKKYKAEGEDLLLKLVNQSVNSKTSVLTNIVIKATATGEDDATLSDLSVSGYTLNPSFDSATEDYTITKEYGAADPVVGDVTAIPSVTGADADIAWDGTNHKFVITVTAKDGVTEKTYNITINEAEAKRGLLIVPFSNGAKGAINVAGLEIRVPYIGTSEPTVVLANIEYQSGVSGASASMESDKLRITGADSNYDDYTLTFVQLTPSALTLDEEVTFDAVPSYAFAPYGWDSGKGVKFAKNVEDGTPRISSGNTRVYFAIQACDEVQLTSGSGGARDVKIYVNGVLSSVTKTAASGSAIKLALDNSQANFIAIESNQTGGDGGFTKILVKTLAANTLAYDDGAYTTGDAALDLSTLISTYNSDAAITYAVKTDGGTNASISGNNFTATAAGTAVITATQVASETVRQASVDFNVVVSAGLAKYIVTYYDDATELGTEEVTEGEHPTATGIVTKKQGFNFLGWSETNGGAVVDLNGITISAAKNLYAKYEAIDCSGTGTKFKFQLKTDLTNGAVFTSAPGEVDLTTANYLSALVGGDVKVSLASGKNTNRVSFYDNKALGFANGDGATISITLTCPLATGDVVRYINYASSGNRMTLSDGTNTININGNGAETIQEIEVPAAWDGAYDLTLVRGGNTPKLTYFEIYRRPVLTAVALNDFTMRKGAKRTPELILTPEDGVVESQVWSITASTPADIATIDAATGEITATEAGEITVQVKLNDNDALVATCTVTIVDAIAQQDVTKSTVWDWHNTGATANIQLTGSTDPKKNEQFVLANVDVDNDEDFESDKLVVEGEYMVRDYDKANPYFQGQLIKFNTTVAGIIRVKFSNTGGNPARELYINGVGTGNTSANATLGWSDYVEVPVGEVSITAYLVDKSGDAEQKYIRVSEIEFFALGHSRSVTAGNLGTLCLPNNFIARGVDVYSLVGKEAEHGKIVFEDLEPDELLVAGQAYIFQAKDATAKFYYSPGEPVDAPLNNTALKGNLGATITFQPNSPEAENVYFVKDHALWSAKETGVNIGQYRAYLQMDAVSELANPNPAPGRRYIMLGTNGTNVATGIDDVQDDVRSTKMLIDGRLFILRGEKLYDATGRLVK